LHNNYLSSLLFSLIILCTIPAFSAVPNTQSCENNNHSSCINILVTNKQSQPITDVIVYLQPLSGQTLPLAEQAITIGQKNKSFAPYLTVMQAGQTVLFANQDDITHHIYSADNLNKFAFKIRAGETKEKSAFTSELVTNKESDYKSVNKATEIAMGCNIHDWMSGYLLIVNTPYYNKTNTQGLATFSIASAGKYQAVIWHPQLNSKNNQMSMPITIEHQPSPNNLSQMKTTQYHFQLTNEMNDIPEQKNEDDFDFLSDYE